MIRITREAGAPSARALRAVVLFALLLALMGREASAAEMRLRHAEPTSVRVVPLGAGGTDPATLQLQLDAGGERHLLRLHPSRVLADPALLPDAAETFQGKVDGYPDSWAALTRTGGRWSGIWYDGAEYFGVDSAASLAVGPGTPPATMMVYRLRDLVWDVEPSLEDDTRLAPSGAADLAEGLPLAVVAPGGQPTRELGIAVVADSLLARRHGAELEAHLLTLLNVVDGLFTSQVGVHVSATSLTILDGQDSPLSSTGDAEDLLEELSAWRASSRQQRQSGLTHLFTGRDLDGRTVGMAYLDTLCSRAYSSSLSQATGPAGIAGLVAAHEIAHVFGAPHDGDEKRACAATPSGFLMSPRISGSQQFSNCSLQQMAPQVQRAACLSTLPESRGWPEQPARPETQGGSGTTPATSLLLLGLLAAAGLRGRMRQMRANFRSSASPRK